jgi:hypothetical protein
VLYKAGARGEGGFGVKSQPSPFRTGLFTYLSKQQDHKIFLLTCYAQR